MIESTIGQGSTESRLELVNRGDSHHGSLSQRYGTVGKSDVSAANAKGIAAAQSTVETHFGSPTVAGSGTKELSPGTAKPEKVKVAALNSEVPSAPKGTFGLDGIPGGYLDRLQNSNGKMSSVDHALAGAVKDGYANNGDTTNLQFLAEQYSAMSPNKEQAMDALKEDLDGVANDSRSDGRVSLSRMPDSKDGAQNYRFTFWEEATDKPGWDKGYNSDVSLPVPRASDPDPEYINGTGDPVYGA